MAQGNEVSRSYEGPRGPLWDAARKAMDDLISGRNTMHTPGPWRVVEPMNPDRAYGIGTRPPTDDPDDAEWEIVAEVCTGEKAVEDAALIAAAPLLVDRLEDCAEALAFTMGEHEMACKCNQCTAYIRAKSLLSLLGIEI